MDIPDHSTWSRPDANRHELQGRGYSPQRNGAAGRRDAFALLDERAGILFDGSTRVRLARAVRPRGCVSAEACRL